MILGSIGVFLSTDSVTLSPERNISLKSHRKYIKSLNMFTFSRKNSLPVFSFLTIRKGAQIYAVNREKTAPIISK